MDVALEVWSASFPEVESTCLLAESLGLAAFYYGESPHELNLDCWTTLAALAKSTERIRLGPVIANILPTYRSTALLARQAATVSAISDGRVEFRTGAGASSAFGLQWWKPASVDYPVYEQRLADVEEAVDLLPQLWSSHATDSTNDHTIPITIAATGERALHLAATRADVWETSFCTPDEFAGRNDRFDRLAAGRAVVRSLEIDGFVSRTGPGVDRLLDRVRVERGTAEDLGPVLERGLVGTPTDVSAQLRELAEAGVEQVVVALHDPHDPNALEAIAEAAATLDR